jgi:hypothetical protein
MFQCRCSDMRLVTGAKRSLIDNVPKCPLFRLTTFVATIDRALLRSSYLRTSLQSCHSDPAFMAQLEGAPARGAVAHLLPQTYKRYISEWLEEDTPSFDYGGFVVGDEMSEAKLLGKSEVHTSSIPLPVSR